MMNLSNTMLTPNFLEHQRNRLETLRDQLLESAAPADGEQRALNRLDGAAVQDAGDVGAVETRQDNTDAANIQRMERLQDVSRALEKIANGSYGLSDLTGEPIHQERLECVPEARLTIDEIVRQEQTP